MTPVPAAHRSVRGPRVGRRAALGVGGGGALALLLTGCGETTRTASGAAAVQDAATGSLPVDPLPGPADGILEMPSRRFRLQGVRTASMLDVEDARTAGLPVPEDASVREVLPARGEMFLLASVTIHDPLHMPSWQVPGAQGDRILVAGTPVGDLPSGQELFVIASVPEDGPDPEHVVLESTAGTLTQRLSLVDGSRPDPEPAPVYGPRPRVTIALNWWEHEREGMAEPLRGFLRAGEVSPVLSDGTWAATGAMLLSLHGNRTGQSSAAGSSTLALILPDGSEAPARGDHSSVLDGGTAWFEVPEDLQEATARVTLRGRDAGGADIELGTQEIRVDVRATLR